MLSSAPVSPSREVWLANMKNQRWRLNNLYYIKNENGQKVKFQFNEAQAWFYDAMQLYPKRIVLKARQMGFSTLIDLILIDSALFKAYTDTGIITHSLSDSKKIFEEKVEFPYLNLPDALRAQLPLITDNARELKFRNFSTVRVGTSLRSSTLQKLHISEFGKICARRPDAAKEIVTGALNTVAPDQEIFIESTAEGRSGYFYDYVQRARAMEAAGERLTNMDYKLFFYPWFWCSRYTIDPEGIILPKEMIEYFDELENNQNIILTPGQRAWYYKKSLEQGDGMKREYPATIDEAFESTHDGRYFSKAIEQLRKDRRITTVTHDPYLDVHTSWDLGRRDMMVIWFFQVHAGQIRWINYFEYHNEGLEFYVGKLREISKKNRYRYGNHYLPHDVGVTDLSVNVSRKTILQDMGVDNIVVVPRTRIADQIEAARSKLPVSWFDESNCQAGLHSLENYHMEWDEKLGCPHDYPAHDEHSHASSAFMTGCIGAKMSGELGGEDWAADEIYRRNRQIV